jgi:hypothetical protein
MRWNLTAMMAGVVTSLAVFGCGGGGGDETLHLRDGDISREDYVTFYRSFLESLGTPAFCPKIQGLSVDEVLEAATEDSGPGSSAVPSEKRTVTIDVWGPVFESAEGFQKVPGQTPDPDDAREVAQIVIDECERISD